MSPAMLILWWVLEEWLSRMTTRSWWFRRGSGSLLTGSYLEDMSTLEKILTRRLSGRWWKRLGLKLSSGEKMIQNLNANCFDNYRSIVAFRHGHNFNFGCSDIYIVVALTPVNNDIKFDEKEISECQWMPLEVRILTSWLLIDNKWCLPGICVTSTGSWHKQTFCSEVHEM